MDISYCDNCKSEIKKEKIYMTYRKDGLLYKYFCKDFCSVKCLREFLKSKFGGE